MIKTIGAIIFAALLSIQVCFGQAVGHVDNALTDLKTNHLSAKNLSIYEEQAILKLKDVLDYASIVGSPKYNLELREVALDAVLLSFDENARLSCSWLLVGEKNTTSKNSSSCTPKEVLGQLLKAQSFDEFFVSGKNIAVKKKLRQLSEDTYQGQLVYQQEFRKKDLNGKTVQEKVNTIRIEYLLKRVDKQFGSTSTMVWEVKLLGMP